MCMDIFFCGCTPLLIIALNLTLYHTIPTLTTLRKKPIENIVGKGENAGNQHFLLFPMMFYILSKT